MVTYKEQQKNKKYFVLLKDGVPLGTFGNLKKVVEFVNNEEFPSYWTLIRDKEFPKKIGDFEIHKVLHH
jgi:hypothetical protein